jgi:hypothetical protein
MSFTKILAKFAECICPCCYEDAEKKPLIINENKQEQELKKTPILPKKPPSKKFSTTFKHRKKRTNIRTNDDINTTYNYLKKLFINNKLSEPHYGGCIRISCPKDQNYQYYRDDAKYLIELKFEYYKPADVPVLIPEALGNKEYTLSVEARKICSYADFKSFLTKNKIAIKADDPKNRTLLLNKKNALKLQQALNKYLPLSKKQSRYTTNPADTSNMTSIENGKKTMQFGKRKKHDSDSEDEYFDNKEYINNDGFNKK